MRTRGRVLLAVGIGILLAAATALLLLSGNVATAIWMEGPYFPLTLLHPGSADTLTSMVAVVATYYFVCSLVALTRCSRRDVILVVLVVVVVNTMGVLAWHRASERHARDHEPVAQHATSGRCLSTPVDRTCGPPN